MEYLNDGSYYRHDLEGRRFGRLTVVRWDHAQGPHNEGCWLCRCDCGGEKVVRRRMLLLGRTQSCGCLVKEALRNNLEHPRTSVVTEKQAAWLMKHYKHTKNQEIMDRLGIGEGTLHRFARRHGLKKSPQFRRKCQEVSWEAARAAFGEANSQRGRFPKGARMGRQFKPGETRKDRIGEERDMEARKKISGTRRRIIRMEKMRMMAGIPRQTKMRISLYNDGGLHTKRRWYLRKLGYVSEDGLVWYWTADTRRSEHCERTYKGAMSFLPYPGMDNSTIITGEKASGR